LILIVAGNYLEAQRWAAGQLLEDSEWHFPSDIDEIAKMSNFHVLIVGTAGMNTPASYFERLLSLAKERGRIGRLP